MVQWTVLCRIHFKWDLCTTHTRPRRKGDERLYATPIGCFCSRRSTYSNWYLRAYFSVKIINLLVGYDQKLHHKSSARHTSSSSSIRRIYLSHALLIYREHLQSAPCWTQASQALNIIIIIIIHFWWICGFEKCGSCIFLLHLLRFALGILTLTFDTHTYSKWVTDILQKMQSTCNQLIKINNLRNCWQRYTVVVWRFRWYKNSKQCTHTYGFFFIILR